MLFYQVYSLLEKEKQSLSQIDATFNYYPVNESTLQQINESLNYNDKNLEKCNISKPICSDPIAKCIHMNQLFKFVPLHNFDKEHLKIYPPNQNLDEGYCLNILDNNYSAKRNINSQINLISCNPNTGERILLKSSVNSYKIGCMCKHPDIITQSLPLTSDCNVPVACFGGKLSGPHWWNPKITIDIVNDLSCIDCPNDTISDRNPLTNQPICRERSFAEKNFDDSEKVYPKNFPVLPLNHPAIDPAFVDKFLYPEKRFVPNPCGFDFFTLQPFQNNECSLGKTSDGKIYFCKSNDIRVVTIQSDDDYLRGNAGTWSNGCFKFIENQNNVNYALAEFYNIPPMTKGSVPHPIIGYAVNPSKLSSNVFNILNLNHIE